MASRIQQFPYCKSPVALVLVCVTTVGRLAVLRGVFAATVDLRIDEAYYSTWSKEGVLSYLDHPPLIAWCIRSGTTLFGDTNFGVRFAGLAQLLLADIVRRLAHDIAYVAFAVLMPEASLHYGLGMAKVTPDIALIPFAVVADGRPALVAPRRAVRRPCAAIELNEWARYIGFREPRPDGEVGLYVAPAANPNTRLWDKTGAGLQTIGSSDLMGRGFKYDVYTFQKVTGGNRRSRPRRVIPSTSPTPTDALCQGLQRRLARIYGLLAELLLDAQELLYLAVRPVVTRSSNV